MLVASLAGALAVTMLGGSPAGAAASVQITQIECAKHPGLFDLVYIKNTGDTPQDMAGWQLRSDPEDGQQMALSVAGVLDPGEQIVVAAGAHAVNLPNEGLYLWTNNEVLRDSGDPPDYARLLNAGGAPVGGLYCTGAPWSPAPAPTAAPTAPPASAPQQPAGQAPATGQQPATQTGTAGAAPRAATGPKSVPTAGGPQAVAGEASLLAAGLVLAAVGAITLSATLTGTVVLTDRRGGNASRGRRQRDGACDWKGLDDA